MRRPPKSSLSPPPTLFRSIFVSVATSGKTAPTADFACATAPDRKSTRLNSSHLVISYAVFCLKKSGQRARPGDGMRGVWRVGRTGGRFARLAVVDEHTSRVRCLPIPASQGSAFGFFFKKHAPPSGPPPSPHPALLRP